MITQMVSPMITPMVRPMVNSDVYGGDYPYVFNFISPMLALPAALLALTETYTRNSAKNVAQNNALVALTANNFGTSQRAGLYGYNAEPAATNLLLGSIAFDDTGAWPGASNIDVTANARVAPDGTTTADLITVPAAGSAYIYQSVAGSAIAHNVSFYIAAGNAPYVYAGIYTSTDIGVIINTATGAVTWYSGSITEILSERVGDFFRVSYTFTGVASIVVTIPRACVSATNLSALEGGTCYLWGGQVEVGSAPSSFVQTPVGATALRAADVLSCTTASITDFVQTGYTLFADFTAPIATLPADGTIVALDDGTGNECAKIWLSTDGKIYASVVDGGVEQCKIDCGAYGATRHKVAFSVEANSALAAVDGVAKTADVSVTMPTVTTLSIGNLAGAEQSGSSIHRAGVIVETKTQPQLNGLTA